MKIRLGELRRLVREALTRLSEADREEEAEDIEESDCSCASAGGSCTASCGGFTGYT